VSGGYDPVAVTAIGAAPDLDAIEFELLVIDARFVASAALQEEVITGPLQRPVVVLGNVDPIAQAEAERRGVRYLARPIDRMALLMAVTLAFATRDSGEPIRARVPRRRVADVDVGAALQRAGY
jgi:hypothetical protein